MESLGQDGTVGKGKTNIVYKRATKLCGALGSQ